MSEHKIEMLAPCEDCIHTNVCSIKQVLAMDSATLNIPAIRWITPRFDSMLVDCSEFIDVINVRPPEKRRTSPKHIRPIGIGPKDRQRRTQQPDVVSAEAWVPLCMEPAEWADWQRLNPRMTNAQDRADRPCVDCPPEYAAEMRAKGRCNGVPGSVAA